MGKEKLVKTAIELFEERIIDMVEEDQAKYEQEVDDRMPCEEKQEIMKKIVQYRILIIATEVEAWLTNFKRIGGVESNIDIVNAQLMREIYLSYFSLDIQDFPFPWEADTAEYIRTVDGYANGLDKMNYQVYKERRNSLINLQRD